MADILIIEDESSLLDALTVGLTNAFPQYAVRGASQVEEVLGEMETHPPKLVISDIKLPGKSGIDFLIEARRSWPSVKFILMSAFAAVTREQALSQGAVQLMRKPFPLKELVNLVQEALQGGSFGGSVEGISLMDLMQLLHMGRKSSVILVEGSGLSGKIQFQNGEVVHAEAGEHTGTEAFHAFVRLRHGQFKLRASGFSGRVTVHESFEKLALDALRLMDEESRDGLPDAEEEAEPGLPPSGSIGSGKSMEVVMSNLNELCKDVVESVDDALACGVVDLKAGRLIGVHHIVPYFRQVHLDAVTAAAVEMFRGKMVRRMEELLSKHRGKEIRNSFEEVFISSTTAFHFMKSLDKKNAVVVLVTKKSTNQGMGWSSMRGSIPTIEAAIP